MRSLIIAACLAASAPLRAGEVPADAPVAADWHKAGLPDGAKEALAGAGYRFEDDGRVLDPETQEPLSSEKLLEAVSRLGLAAQRLALERLDLILSKDTLDAADREAISALKESLPEAVAKAVDARKSAADLRRLVGQDLSRISSYFDAARTMGERRDAAQPVRAAEPGRRVALPYFNESERRAGETLNAAAGTAIARDAFGRTVLARLNGDDGKPALPPVIVSDLPGGAVAAYDYRRRALVVDRATMLMSVTEDAPPQDRAALSKTLASRQALVDHLARHPEAAASFAAKNDALLVHELTHAWQDRRDTLMREMARGNLPQALIIDYEVEAWTTKNLYIHSRLKHDPRARIDVFELEDYTKMNASYAAWEDELKTRYSEAIPDAMEIKTVAAIQVRRLAATRARAASTTQDQTAKALDLLGMTRAERGVQRLSVTQKARHESLLRDGVAGMRAESAAALAEHYLSAALHAPNPIETSVLLQKAEDFARESGDKELLARVRARKGRSR